jgi:hypothetical protein
MASVASQLMEEVTAHAQSDSLEDAREICADGTYFLNNPHSNHVFLAGLLCQLTQARGGHRTRGIMWKFLCFVTLTMY